MKSAKKKRDEITIIGFVDPLDDYDDEAGVKITTDDDEYVVEMNRNGKKLMNMIDEEVQVTGVVTLSADGTKIIDVSYFDYAPYEEYDDEEED
jgi:hypothetical protein